MGQAWMRFAEHLQKKIGALLRFPKVSDMRRMNVYVYKNRATSRRFIQRCDVPEGEIFNIATFQCHDVSESEIFNIATLGSKVATFLRVT